MNPIERILKYQNESAILAKVNQSGFGIDQKYISVSSYEDLLKVKMADRPVEPDTEYYYISGPLDTKTRQFCKSLLFLDKVFSKQEIEQLIDQADLDQCLDASFDYIPGPVQPRGGFGGPNCRHRLIRFRGQLLLTPAPTDRQIRNIANKSIFK